MTSRPRLFSKIILKATSPQLLPTQVLDHLWRLRSENDQQYKVYWLSYAVMKIICLTTARARFYNQR